MTKFLILQWGKERSIIENVNTQEVFIIDNQHLMNLDENGVIL
jgi:hypothetical protein